MSITETCQERVYPPGRAMTGHACGRKLKGDPEFPELCGTHVAASRRRREKDAAREEIKTQYQDTLRADQERVCKVEGVLGFAVTLKTAMSDTGPDAFIRRSTGQALVDISALESVVAELSNLRSQLAEAEQAFR